mmetsp:Transcript_72684/g.151817  ORF Transcript_72684/g.151817 Transcript_72684/m.151817 type:complete len:167 (+) Transcript_72684:139-639(+)
MSSVTEKAQKWFEICDERKRGKISLALGHAAKSRILLAISGEGGEKEAPKLKAGAEMTVDAFVKEVQSVVEQTGEEEVGKELDVMIKEVETLGVPPVETGDPVRDMNEYRRYHGMDKALGWLLQKLVTEQPDDPVNHLLSSVEAMPAFAVLRHQMGDQPYDGNFEK